MAGRSAALAGVLVVGALLSASCSGSADASRASARSGAPTARAAAERYGRIAVSGPSDKAIVCPEVKIVSGAGWAPADDATMHVSVSADERRAVVSFPSPSHQLTTDPMHLRIEHIAGRYYACERS
jgi:hypothetical protein